MFCIKLNSTSTDKRGRKDEWEYGEKEKKRGHGSARGGPKNCQGISFSKHRKFEALQDRGAWTHTSYISKLHTSLH